MPKPPQIGDILEIPTKKGLAYVQFSHFNEAPPKLGAIIRVLPRFFHKRPTDFGALAAEKELYYTFFPVKAAVSRNIFALVGHAEVPVHARAFPHFRCGAVIPSTGKVEQWWLWDGNKEWKIEKLSDEQFDLPIRSGWNDAMLIKRIEQGWTPRHDELFMWAARANKEARKQTGIKSIRHILLFKTVESAKEGKLMLDKEGLRSEIIDNGSGVSLIVTQGVPLSEEYTETLVVKLSEIARRIGGIYDAWETSL